MHNDAPLKAPWCTQAAVEEGIVPGGGSALLHASKTLDELKLKLSDNFDQKVGVQIIQNALRVSGWHGAGRGGVRRGAY